MPPAGTRGDTQLHVTLLIVSGAVLILSFLLEIHGEEQVRVPIVHLALPGVCTYKQLVGRDCPGCGLTRCFISLAHGDVRRAWDFNPAGVYFFALVASQLPYRAFQLWRLRRGRDELRVPWLTGVALGTLVLSLFVQWLVRIAAALV